jgi:hypothetical protein
MKSIQSLQPIKKILNLTTSRKNYLQLKKIGFLPMKAREKIEEIVHRLT